MKKVIFVFIFMVLSSSFAFADAEPLALPVPSGTQVIKETKRNLADMKFDVIYYQSTESVEAIRKFYRKQLKGYGWEEVDFSVPLTKLDMGKENVRSFMEKNLAFQKKDIILTISFIPDNLLPDGKTGYSLSRGSIALKNETAVPDINDSLTKIKDRKEEKQDFAPEYPGAERVWLFKRQNGATAVYVSRDSVDKIERFYKMNMPKFSWRIENDGPAEILSEHAYAVKYGNCADCPKGDVNVRVTNKIIDFSNTKGQACRITLIRRENIKEKDASKFTTEVRLDYEKAKNNK